MDYPVISVKLQGGLGNQMFQLASAYGYARQVGGIFVTTRTKPEPDSRPTMYWDSLLIAWKPFLTDTLPSDLFPVGELAATMFMGILEKVPLPGIYLNGYLQSSKYFGPFANEIRQLMAPPAPIQEKVRLKYNHLLTPEMLERIVVVHARRTDYLKAADFHGPLTANYYKKATERMLETLENPVFLLVSDDQSFWHGIWSEIPAFQTCDSIFLNSTEDDVNTLVLLQQFKNIILANSTFSWWAAWLSNSRRVMAPAAWFGPSGLKPHEYEDIYETHWERI